MNAIFFGIVAISFAVAGWRQIAAPSDMAPGTGPMEILGIAMIDGAGGAVTLAIGLIGVMTFFLGLMKVAEAGGLLAVVAKTVRPLMVRLFPDVPPDHPAMGAMIMNLSANALGLGNAATPFGIRAMQQLDRLNPAKGTATNAMVLFLAINTSSVTLLPTGVIALRAAAGSTDAAGIVPTTLFATICSTTVAILAAKLYARFSPGGASSATAAAGAADDDVPPEGEETGAYPLWVSVLVLGGIAAMVPATILWGRAIAPWIVPGLAIAFLGYGLARKVPVYEVFVEGAKDGFQVAVKIIPYLVAILTAVAMFRASGAMEMLLTPLGALTAHVGLPAEALPMALLRPLSGSGAYGIVAAIVNDPAIGPDSLTGYLVSTLQGSTETTFYVVAVYFGAVQIKRMRHALWTALTADAAGIAAAVFICNLMYG
ncbi:Nucleoside recognition domain-containing protein [uncultured Alphaproteobacteria bacterium]|uniref:Nucleoside recognition domain-containing protein n=1 Tax=uncultured Alphaproteobacteria bacterium TaxID=91750 RepID=A0A212JGC6_9PROT|nr:Nucleoside recognition domain-containing protein [uncultured Alphaproteobacteria bacterium]